MWSEGKRRRAYVSEIVVAELEDADDVLQCSHSPSSSPSPSRPAPSVETPKMASASDRSTSSFVKDDPLDGTPTSSHDLLLGSFDPAKLHPMAGIDDKLDYLLLDDEKTSDLPGAGTAIPSRGWSDDLCYGTGTMYLSGPYSLSPLHVHPSPHHPSHPKTIMLV